MILKKAVHPLQVKEVEYYLISLLRKLHFLDLCYPPWLWKFYSFSGRMNLSCARRSVTFKIKVLERMSVTKIDQHTGGHIALNSIQRRCAKVSAAESVDVTRFVPPENFNLAMLTVELDFVKRVGSRSEQIDALVLAKQLRRRLNNQVMTAGQKVLFEFQGNNYSFTVREATVEGRGKSNSIERGIILEDTFFVFDAPRDSGIKIINQREGTTSNIFKLNVYLHGRTMEGSQGFRYWLTCDSEIYETYEEIVRFQQKSSEALKDDPTSSLLIPCILGDEIYLAMKKIIGLVSS